MTEPFRLAASLVWASACGPRLDDDAKALIGAGIGGLVISPQGFAGRDALAGLVAEARSRARGPLRLAIDGLRLPMGLAAIGAADDPGLARAAGRAAGEELRSLGLDTIFGPSLDRRDSLADAADALGDEPGLVARLGTAIAAGYLDAGILPIPGAFPGEGRRPAIGLADEVADSRDLAPFRAIVAVAVPGLLVSAHRAPAFDPDRPALLSPLVAQHAREALGFAGLLVSAPLSDTALRARYPVELAAERALIAGLDMLRADDDAWAVISGLEIALRWQRITPERAAEAALRVAAYHRLAEGAIPAGWQADGAAVGAEIAGRALTIVRGAGRLPLDPSRPTLLVELRPPIANPSPMASALSDRLTDLVVARIDDDGRGLDRALDLRPGRQIIVASRDVHAWSDASLVLSAFGPEAIRVALGAPRDLALGCVPIIAVAAYGTTAEIARGVVTALCGTGAWRTDPALRL